MAFLTKNARCDRRLPGRGPLPHQPHERTMAARGRQLRGCLDIGLGLWNKCGFE